ncbi:winged helix-turn-helix DNA-binding family protein [Mycobacterium xenopi 4042]|uniref:Winged helix-turn-helix DNA-binding family protein n=1 Tax=Mycobacterium xenopi 4042 TaxID=1299334 RepID=X8AF69_MYCXE|nr:winged helix-turn-helix DNA-binding family protein [Mycobacterium xenopi 4042]
MKILQAIRLKGRIHAADLARTVGEDPLLVASTVARLAETGLIVAGNTLKLSPPVGSA